MGEPAVGLILAALDVDIDNGAAWNRWYDLEHLAPNLALPEVVTGHRYVAPPALHDCRIAASDDAVWGGGRSVYLTWYATSVDPAAAIAAMSARRDELEAAGRMDGAGARVVRSGDALTLLSTASDPNLRLDERDLVHVGHVALRLVIDRDERLASLSPGVVASLRFGSAFSPGRFAELQLLADDPRSVLDELRAAESRRRIEVDVAFDRIEPLQYPFLAAIEKSRLPRWVDEV
ncbi:MAG: hypothetical protein CL433_11335 [Acidimicrobiaceae bacterium]|nr:hypothetical protein [Acidimicrobiaceae bacterium]HAB58342.1 hypothetical protein [Acidimicrobiaceae bacterium]